MNGFLKQHILNISVKPRKNLNTRPLWPIFSISNRIKVLKKVNNKIKSTDKMLTSLRIKRSKHQNASASSSRRIIIGEHRSHIPAQNYKMLKLEA